jgi:hypothetical protein
MALRDDCGSLQPFSVDAPGLCGVERRRQVAGRKRAASSGKQMMRLLDASSPAPQSRISGCFQETSLFPLFRMRTAKPTVAKMGALCVCY